MNSNAKFTGFSPEELAAEAQTPKEEPVEYEFGKSLSLTKDEFQMLKDFTEKEEVKKALAEQGLEVNKEALAQYDDFLNASSFTSPESGQDKYPGLSAEAQTEYNQFVAETAPKPQKKHKKKKSSLGNLPPLQTIYYNESAIANLKGAMQGTWTDVVKANDLVAEQKTQQNLVNQKIDATNAQYNDFLSAADIQKAAKKLKEASVKPHQYFTHTLPNSAVSPISSWLKNQLKEAKEVIKQLSGEPTEFIYIHPFDLYELLNSFVIPPLLQIDKEFQDPGYIEISGKKYKQSTMMPIKSKNTVVDASKYNQPDWSNCDVCYGTQTGHLCDLHYPTPNEIK